MLNTAPYAPVPDEYLAKLAFISPNEYEASLLSGVQVSDRESAFLAANALLDKGVGAALITLGSQGAVYLDRDQRLQPLGAGHRRRGSTAAGDSFVGAFCTAICAGASVEEAMLRQSHRRAHGLPHGRSAQPAHDAGGAAADGRERRPARPRVG